MKRDRSSALARITSMTIDSFGHMLDLSSGANEGRLRKARSMTVAQALRSDWTKIGSDMRVAIVKVAGQNGKATGEK